jgi:S1-C subfamily serine protease
MLLLLLAWALPASGKRVLVVPSTASAQVTSGSGFFISPGGMIVTGAHVVTGCTTVSVWPQDGVVRSAKVIANDPTLDIAILSAPGKAAIFVTAPDDQEPPLGTPVFALGYGVLVKNPRHAVPAEGTYIGSATLPSGVATRVISADLQHGQSGGPVVDRNGSLFGMIVGRNSDRSGNGIVLPTPEVASFLSTHDLPLLRRSPESQEDPRTLLRAVTVLVQCRPASR